MSNHLINLDYYKCCPDLCNKGVCAAASACPLKLIIQEEPFDYPMTFPFVCKGCAKCVSACPLEAIHLS